MSRLDRRVQVLLDEERFARVEQVARASGRSVGAVIRDAIDRQLGAPERTRAQAAEALLAAPAGPAEDWADVKVELAAELDGRFEP